MKKIFLVSAIMFFTANSSFALIDAEGEKKPQKRVKQWASKYDENKDGIITKEESRAANERMFNLIDENKDGQITPDERKAFAKKKKSEFNARKAEMIKKFDIDKDGKLSEQERNALKAELKARREANKSSVKQ